MSRNNPSGIPTEHFRVNFQIDPSSKLSEREFIGMGSVFGSAVENLPTTIVEKGAFTKTLIERKDKIPVLWQHDMTQPVGVPLELKENDAGLYIRGKLSKTERGNEALELMRDGALKGLSIGFDPIKWNMTKENDSDPEWDAVRHITELKLWEVSLVTFGADPNALISEVRSAHGKPLHFMDAVDLIVETLGESLSEALRGKYLDAKNEPRIKNALDALTELFKTAEPPGKRVIGPGKTTALTVDAELMELELAEAEAGFTATQQEVSAE